MLSHYETCGKDKIIEQIKKDLTKVGVEACGEDDGEEDKG